MTGVNQLLDIIGIILRRRCYYGNRDGKNAANFSVYPGGYIDAGNVRAGG